MSPPGGTWSPGRGRTADPPIFRTQDNSSPNTARVRDLHSGTQLAFLHTLMEKLPGGLWPIISTPLGSHGARSAQQQTCEWAVVLT
jgi:hypothetical protein